jgi:alpha-tubulin suppressor-like RCC1 family protein
VAGGHEFARVSAGSIHACGLDPNGRAFCWGNGASGALGNGRTYLSFWPRPLSGNHRFSQLSSGSGDPTGHTCGVATSGRLFCWGINNDGQLGDGTQTARLKPVAVVGGLSFTQVRAGNEMTCATTVAGEGYCWGVNQDGQLGDGLAEILSPVPVRVLGPA